jgi:hypothetical protein
MRVLVLAAVLVAASAAAGPDVRAPKLETEESRPAPPSSPDPGRARPLPRTAAVCQDPAGRRCWVAARESECGASGQVFRVVIDDPARADVADALADCRAQWN